MGKRGGKNICLQQIFFVRQPFQKACLTDALFVSEFCFHLSVDKSFHNWQQDASPSESNAKRVTNQLQTLHFSEIVSSVIGRNFPIYERGFYLKGKLNPRVVEKKFSVFMHQYFLFAHLFNA